MKNFQEVFAGYGADYDTTIARFAGNETMYLRILGMLPKDESMNKLGLAIQSKDLEAAFEAAHTLKGVAGNLGLTPLFKAVCTIVEPLRNREARGDYMQLYEEIQKEYQRAEDFLNSLRQTG